MVLRAEPGAVTLDRRDRRTVEQEILETLQVDIERTSPFCYIDYRQSSCRVCVFFG